MKIKFDILQYSPCNDAKSYYDSQSSSEEAWNNCLRGDWMLWIASMLGVDIKTLTLTKVHCALTVKHLMKDKHGLDALEAGLKFVNNEITSEELKIAANAAVDAANAAHAVDAYAAARAAAHVVVYAAYAAYAAAHVVAYAAHVAANTAYADYVAAHAVYAAYDAANVAARAAKIKNQKETADICRKYLTKAVFKKIK